MSLTNSCNIFQASPPCCSQHGCVLYTVQRAGRDQICGLNLGLRGLGWESSGLKNVNNLYLFNLGTVSGK